MPVFNIVKESEIKESFRTNSIIGQFDLNIEKIKEQFVGNIAIEDKDWSVGLIVGSSGSGKSTIAKTIFPDYYIKEYEYTTDAVVDNMPKELTVEKITNTFNSVGFATAWSWLKPYNVLSNGEKMRVDLARAILENRDVIVFDEFTSVVDRTVAKTASASISKSVRKMGKKFVAVACHRDIIEWLEPDWIYDTDEQRFFFANQNTNDQKLILKYENVVQKYGDYLGNIII